MSNSEVVCSMKRSQSTAQNAIDRHACRRSGRGFRSRVHYSIVPEVHTLCGSQVAAQDSNARYALGSVLSHVLLHQTIIGEEALLQLAKIDETPDILVRSAIVCSDPLSAAHLPQDFSAIIILRHRQMPAASSIIGIGLFTRRKDHQASIVAMMTIWPELVATLTCPRRQAPWILSYTTASCASLPHCIRTICHAACCSALSTCMLAQNADTGTKALQKHI